MATAQEPTTRALAPWFGGSRMLAHHVGEELNGCEWVGIPFAGGMGELTEIKARAIVVNDLHRGVINLAEVAAHPIVGPQLYRRLRRQPFHEDVLRGAQAFCEHTEPHGYAMLDLDWAFHYFITCWMGRSSKAGTEKELSGELSSRWNANGGGSNTRYRSAVRSLLAWRRILSRCEFRVMDALEFLGRCLDASKHGLYCDPPFPGPGARYKHTFTEQQHRQLAAKLAQFHETRVVCRFYDHELIRELYPESRWTWRRFAGRTQTNAEAPEVLLLNGPSHVNTEARSLFR